MAWFSAAQNWGGRGMSGVARENSINIFANKKKRKEKQRKTHRSEPKKQAARYSQYKGL
jgi:hypothetical protein